MPTPSQALLDPADIRSAANSLSQRRLQLWLAFFTPYLALAALVGILEVNYQVQLARFPRGVAAYLTPYDLSNPTDVLIRDQIGSRVGVFDDRQIVLLIGNSVVWGAGALDKLALDRELAKEFNVINAALPGEYLSASAALAVYAADETLRRHPAATFHIFVVYPISRFNFDSAYWAFGEPFARICAAAPWLQAYIFDCDGLLKKFPRRALRDELKNRIVRGAPCQLNPALVLTWAKFRRFYCEPFLDRANDNPQFVAQYYTRGLKFGEVEEIRDFFSAHGLWVKSSGYRADAVAQLSINVGRVSEYLKSRHVRSTVHIIFLGEAPSALNSLIPETLSEYREGTSQLVSDLRRVHPEWTTNTVGPFDDADYYDIAHLKETGQSKLARAITALVK